MIIESAVVEEKLELARNLVMLTLNAPQIAPQIAPGQFVSVLPPVASGAYLRRPFSVAGAKGTSLQLLIRPIGPVSRALCNTTESSKIELLGPLGKPYPPICGEAWLCAGGTGAASLLFLAEWRQSAGLPTTIIWGGKSADQLPPPSLLPESCLIATDDGSCGETGFVGDVLAAKLERSQPTIIVACGPSAMLRQIKDLSAACHLPCLLSLEEFMACGVGACAGCVVELAAGGYARVCFDGPVFDAREVRL